MNNNDNCTCMEGQKELSTSICGSLVHGTIKQYVLENFDISSSKCKKCGSYMTAYREPSFYQGKWYHGLSCDECGNSKYICQWWREENLEGKLKQKYIDKEIQRRIDNNLPMGKEG